MMNWGYETPRYLHTRSVTCTSLIAFAGFRAGSHVKPYGRLMWPQEQHPCEIPTALHSVLQAGNRTGAKNVVGCDWGLFTYVDPAGIHSSLRGDQQGPRHRVHRADRVHRVYRVDRWRPETKTQGHEIMMTSSNGNIFRVTGHLCGEFTGPGEFPHKGQWRELSFDLRLNKRLTKQPWG